ncbi:MAG: LamG domain-containing protein, partial [Thermoguttaceae bacterium]|nr:LamG domain-containing protein [Thermoguttaceae bacterium]
MARATTRFLAARLAWAALAAMTCASWGVAGEPAAGPDRRSLKLEMLFEDNLADSAKSPRTGIAHGTPAFVEGRHGKAIALDGRTWIDTTLMQEELGDEFTVECWVCPEAQQNAYADLFGNHVAAGLGFVVQQDGPHVNQYAAAYGAGNGRWVITGAVPLVAGRWQHVALVKAREEIRLYVHGVLVAAEQDPAPARPSPMPVAVGLGYTSPERCFRGRMDDFRVWNKALETFGHAGIDPAMAREARGLV